MVGDCRLTSTTQKSHMSCQFTHSVKTLKHIPNVDFLLEQDINSDRKGITILHQKRIIRILSSSNAKHIVNINYKDFINP